MVKTNVNTLRPSPELIDCHKSGNAQPKSHENRKSAEHYAFEVVETASLGKCCVDDTLSYWDALKELTNTHGLNERELRVRMSAIAGLVTVGQRFAVDMSSLMESVHREHEATYNDFMSAKGAA